MISGRSRFQPKEPHLEKEGLFLSDVRPIRHAEVVVFKEGDHEIIQCGHTDKEGNFSLPIPLKSDGTSYKVQVRTQAKNPYAHFAVFDCPEEKDPYTISSSSFTAESNREFTLELQASDAKAGAFYIFDEIIEANRVLKDKTKTCSTTNTDCKTDPFEIPTQDHDFLGVYWEHGFNPNSYFGEGDSGLSFFAKLTGSASHEYRMFILGGVSGDVVGADTDHFDSSVILHEYWHYLHEVFSKSDNPAGSHSFGELLDPRLAFEEAFAYFFQAAIISSKESGDPFPYIIDTLSETGSSRIHIANNENLQKGTLTYYGATELRLSQQQPEEGNYREAQIIKTFWKLYNRNTADSDEGLRALWSVMTNSNDTDRGLASHVHKQRDMSHFLNAYETLYPDTMSNPFLSTLSSEQKHSSRPFLQEVTPSNSPCDQTLSGVKLFSIDYINKALLESQLPQSDIPQNFNIHKAHLAQNYRLYFWSVTQDISNPDIKLQIPNPPSGLDLDLYLFRSAHELEDSNCTGLSFLNDFCLMAHNNEESDETPLDISSLPQGTYALVVHRYLDIIRGGLSRTPETSVSFRLQQGDKHLCP